VAKPPVSPVRIAYGEMDPLARHRHWGDALVVAHKSRVWTGTRPEGFPAPSKVAHAL